MNTPTKALRWLTDEPRHRIGGRIAQAGVGALILFRLATESRRAAYLWGPDGIAAGSMRWQFGDALGRVLDGVFTSVAGVHALLGVLALSALALVAGRATRLASLTALLTFVMLEQRNSLVGDGGDNIARVVLVFMPLLLAPRERAPSGGVRVWLHNLAVVAIIAQVLMLYETAGFMKAAGERWHHGTAIYYISQVDLFWHPAAKGLARSPLVAVATYATIFHQLMFPVAFVSRLRLAWIAVGMSFHLGIAAVMGLVPFSTVMMGLELALLSDHDYARVRAAWQSGRVALARARLQLVAWARMRARGSEHTAA